MPGFKSNGNNNNNNRQELFQKIVEATLGSLSTLSTKSTTTANDQDKDALFSLFLLLCSHFPDISLPVIDADSIVVAAAADHVNNGKTQPRNWHGLCSAMVAHYKSSLRNSICSGDHFLAWRSVTMLRHMLPEKAVFAVYKELTQQHVNELLKSGSDLTALTAIVRGHFLTALELDIKMISSSSVFSLLVCSSLAEHFEEDFLLLLTHAVRCHLEPLLQNSGAENAAAPKQLRQKSCAEILELVEALNGMERHLQELCETTLCCVRNDVETPGLLAPCNSTYADLSSVTANVIPSSFPPLPGRMLIQAPIPTNFDVLSLASGESSDPDLECPPFLDTDLYSSAPKWNWRSLFQVLGPSMMRELRNSFAENLATILRAMLMEPSSKETAIKSSTIPGLKSVRELADFQNTIQKTIKVAATHLAENALNLRRFAFGFPEFDTTALLGDIRAHCQKITETVEQSFPGKLFASAVYATLSAISSVCNSFLSHDEESLVEAKCYVIFSELFHLLNSKLIQQHRKVIRCYILHDSGSNYYSDLKPFFENESISFSVRAWKVYMCNVWDDIWQLDISNAWKKRFFSELICEGLQQFCARFANCQLSPARVLQFRCDIIFILFATEEFLLNCASCPKDIFTFMMLNFPNLSQKFQCQQFGSKVDLPVFDSDQNGVRNNPETAFENCVDRIHVLCNQLLAVLTIVASPLESLYRSCKKGYNELEKKWLESPKPLTPWLNFANPNVFSSDCRNYCDLDTTAAVYLHLKLLTLQTDRNYCLLLQVKEFLKIWSTSLQNMLHELLFLHLLSRHSTDKSIIGIVYEGLHCANPIPEAALCMRRPFFWSKPANQNHRSFLMGFHVLRS